MSTQTPRPAAEIRKELMTVNQGSARHKELMRELEAASKEAVAKKRASG
jgi:hypothetical protein